MVTLVQPLSGQVYRRMLVQISLAELTQQRESRQRVGRSRDQTADGQASYLGAEIENGRRTAPAASQTVHKFPNFAIIVYRTRCVVFPFPPSLNNSK